MAAVQRLTTNSSETDLNALFSGEAVFSIPYFQRAYKWEPKKLARLEKDLLNLVDDPDMSHFLGAIIIHGRPSDPSDPKVYEVIDGQQRLTTVFLFLCAITRILCKNGEYNEAAALFLKYLVINRDISLSSNSKLHSSKDDRAQLNSIFEEILADLKFKEKLPHFAFKKLQTNAGAKGKLRSNYQAALRFFDDQVKKEGLDRLRALYKMLVQSVTLVQIDVTDPTNGPKIFDSLNSQQEPMTTGDLVRNEIFRKVANEHPDKIETIHSASWEPFYKKFEFQGRSLFDSYFFPYGLIVNPNVRKSEVFATLREEWRHMNEPSEMIGKLSEYQNAFLDLTCGTNHQGHSKDIARAFKRLYEAMIPSSTYPFLMQLSNAVKSQTINEGECVDVLELIESFLVRRAICGHEPTGLHAVFKKLWVECKGNFTAANIMKEIRGHRTVVVPTDKDVIEAITSRPLYGASITKFILNQWDTSLGGDKPPVETWIEHVLPEEHKEWKDKFDNAQHASMKDLLANLILLSAEMNRELSNGPYTAKRKKYSEDSGYKSARKFAEEYADWSPAQLKSRTAKLADWAVSHWKLA